VRKALVLGAAATLLGLLAVGCGGSSGPGFTAPGAAKVYQLVDFKPSAPVQAGKPVRISFVVQQPDGSPLVRFKRGSGPHTGVHVILVRRDLADLIHKHPPIAADGTVAETVTFPAPGSYRLVVDVYPATGPQANFQLFGSVRVSGAYRPKPLPPPGTEVDVGGYHFALHGATGLKAIQAALVTVSVTDPQGQPARFTPWYGALAHAIFFRQGSLDYFHTHVCAPGVSGCTSVLGGAKVTGSSATPGKLKVGVLVPAPGTWRLFLQCQVGDRVLTAPFTLRVG
jgi:hypothetical protein